MKNSLLTIVGVVLAVVIAWFLVDVMFHLAWFIAKVVIVGIVAIGVFALLRMMLSRSSD